MPKKNDDKNDNSEKEIDGYAHPDNTRMVNLAVNGVALLREDLIDDFRKALYPPITENSKIAFMNVCKKAKIKTEIAEELYKGLTEGFAPAKEMDVWP